MKLLSCTMSSQSPLRYKTTMFGSLVFTKDALSNVILILIHNFPVESLVVVICLIRMWINLGRLWYKICCISLRPKWAATVATVVASLYNVFQTVVHIILPIQEFLLYSLYKLIAGENWTEVLLLHSN